MAEGKKSFIIYCDLIHVVSKLPNEKAGELFKHILEYVNDKNPETDDLLLQILFEPIKLQMKRDLQKWEDESVKRSKSGQLGGIKSGEARRKQIEANEASALNSKQTQANEAVTVNVTVNDTVNDNEIIEEKFSFRKSLLSFGFEKELVDQWLLVRKNKKATNTKIAFENFILEVQKTKKDKNQLLKEIISNSWSGFKHTWLKPQTFDKTPITPIKPKNIDYENA